MGAKHIPTKSTHTHFMSFVQQQNDNCMEHTTNACHWIWSQTKIVHSFTDLIWWWILLVTHIVWRPPFVTWQCYYTARFFGFIFERNLKIDAKIFNSVHKSQVLHIRSLSLARSHTLLIMLIKWCVDRSESEFTALDEHEQSSKQSMVFYTI